ncbi:MAG: hypothetical protein AAB637_00970, partial [Patescibacteria group bacterium]
MNIPKAFADSLPLSGWGWSSNIGWVKFNPKNDINTDVVVNSASGMMSGYAWSSSIGWIQFGGLSGFPGSGGNANVNMNTGVVRGWARALTAVDRTDGWDGWIELGGVKMNPTTRVFSGYAWGSDVIGW